METRLLNTQPDETNLKNKKINMTTTMLSTDFNPHMGCYSHVEVDGFTFQDPQNFEHDLDFDNDVDAARDIDEFTTLLACVDDEETARDIDDFADLMNVLSKNQYNDVESDEESLNDLLAGASFPKKVSFAADNETRHVESDGTASNESDDEDDFLAVNQTFERTIQSTFQAPIDPRCCIQTPIFKTVDSRIPRAYIPKMDVNFGFSVRPASPVLPAQFAIQSMPKLVPPPSSPGPSVASSEEQENIYVHDPATCWVCKSDKCDERKRVLHRYVEKRNCRNWKRGARYKARSRVASSRVREGGRFVTKCEWVAVDRY